MMGNLVTSTTAYIFGKDPTNSPLDGTQSKTKAAQDTQSQMGRSTGNSADGGGSPKGRSSHRKAVSESLIDFDTTQESRGAAEVSNHQIVATDQLQKEPKHPTRGQKISSKTYQEDEISQERNASKSLISKQQGIINDLETKLNKQASKTKIIRQENLSAQAHITHLKHSNEGLQHELVRLRKEMEELRGTCWTLQDQAENFTQELKEQRGLAKELDKANETCNQLRTQWQEATAEVEQLQKTSRKLIIDDDTIISMWNSLSYRIRNLASKASMDKGALLTPTAQQRQRFGYIGLHFEKYYPSHASILLQSYIWENLMDFLAVPGKIWSLEAGKAVASITNTIFCHPKSNKDDLSRWQEWRADTNNLLHDYCDKFDGLDGDTQDRLIKTLSLHFLQCSTSLNREELVMDLREIIHKLLEFCSVTARARAAYISIIPNREDDDASDRPHKPMKFREDEMEYMAQTSANHGGLVDLIVSPGLAKYGNSDGENYDQREILCKVGVAI